MRPSSCLLAVGALVAVTAARAEPASLTILHNNDGESALLPFADPAGHGGVARALTALDTLRALARDDGRDVLVLSSGDNFLAGLTREAFAGPEYQRTGHIKKLIADAERKGKGASDHVPVMAVLADR